MKVYKRHENKFNTQINSELHFFLFLNKIINYDFFFCREKNLFLYFLSLKLNK